MLPFKEDQMSFTDGKLKILEIRWVQHRKFI